MFVCLFIAQLIFRVIQIFHRDKYIKMKVIEMYFFFFFFFLIVYSLLNIHRDLPVLFCIFFGLLRHILCRGLPNALFSFAAPWTRTQTVAMPTWCTNALTTSATQTPSAMYVVEHEYTYMDLYICASCR